ncbi:DUF1566 domain-containing protein [Deltaproteobacteria bacterium TL4]
MWKRIISSLIGIGLAFSPSVWAETQTVVEEGIAYIGNGITVEDAQKVAVNKALNKALNGMGAFIESSQKSSGGRLTAKEVSSITGAVMQSKILETKNEVEGATFLIRVKVQFQIDMESFNRALAKYQEESKDKQVIAQLMGSMQKLQEQLLKTQKGSFATIEIADEIAFNTKKLGDLLTTKEVINNELEIQNMYIQKIRAIMLNDLMPLMTPFLREIMVWDKVPQENRGQTLFLPFVGAPKENPNYGGKDSDGRVQCMNQEYTNNYFKPALAKLYQTAKDYDALQLKTRPELEFESAFATPFILYVNQDEYPVYLKTRVSGNASGLSMTVNREGRIVDLNFRLEGNSLRSELSCGQYNLDEKYRLTDIQQFDWRVKPSNPSTFELGLFQKMVYAADSKINGDGTVTHRGLMWQQAGDKEYAWEKAINYCKALRLAGYQDWRLPAIEELQMLIENNHGAPFINTTLFPNTQSSSYWSSTTYAYYTSFAWSVNFYFGYVSYYNKTYSFYVRCVRGGQ